MDFIDIIVRSPLRSALSVLLMAGISYLFRLSLAQRSQAVADGRNLVESLRPKFYALIQTDDDAVTNINDAASMKHEAAIGNNIKQVTCFQQIRLRLAWNKLGCHHRDKGKRVPGYIMYTDYGLLNRGRRMRPIVITRIQRNIFIAS